MDVYRVSFFGHRTLYRIRELEKQVEDLARKLMQEKEFVEFYVGRNGDFDILVASAIKQAQAAEGSRNSALILVLSYPVTDLEYYEKFYDEIILREDENVHYKAAITKQNEWMVEQSDLTVAYVQRESGGAHRAVKHAEKCGTEIRLLSVEKSF